MVDMLGPARAEERLKEGVGKDAVVEDLLEAVREHLEFGSKVAMQNSHAETEDQLHPLREVPRWTWPGDDDGG